jgi:hypothetical protein
MEQQSQKPDFVADAQCHVQDLQPLNESKIAEALFTWEVRLQPLRTWVSTLRDYHPDRAVH